MYDRTVQLIVMLLNTWEYMALSEWSSNVVQMSCGGHTDLLWSFNLFLSLSFNVIFFVMTSLAKIRKQSVFHMC